MHDRIMPAPAPAPTPGRPCDMPMPNIIYAMANCQLNDIIQYSGSKSSIIIHRM